MLLRDAQLRILGYIEPTGTRGNLILRDRERRVKGYYDAQTNLTKDAGLKIVGHGNLLTTLLNTP